MTSSTPRVAPMARAPGEGEARWGFGFLATLKTTSETTDGRVAVIEHLGPRGRRLAAPRPPPRRRVVLRLRG
jgi:hypothetical protein